MGYRFSIQNANSVGNLVEKNTLSFLKTTISSDQFLEPNIQFIENFLFNTTENLLSSYSYRNAINPRLYELQKRWPRVKDEIYQLKLNKGNSVKQENILYFLLLLSSILANCRKKSILLPGFGYSDINNSMTDKSFLGELVNIHPGESVLILQLMNFFETSEIPLLNVFSKFNTALTKSEQWPGVLLWDDNDSLFVPVENRDDVIDIFNVLKYEKDAFKFIRKEILEKKKKKNYSYLFHLSDLHFGNKTAESRKLRVVSILENHLSKLEDCSKAYPIITGDLVDSPTISNKNAYNEFSELLTSKGFESPIQILGNHDIDSGGFFKKLNKEKEVIQSLISEQKIEIIEDLKLCIIKFNSNYGGQFAQGQIGENQFIEIGNALDKIKREDLTYIAILHHHPIKIENPTWYQEEWYEAILGSIGYEQTMKLKDSDTFLEFLKNRNIKFALHGHKHIPKIHKHEDINVIAAGSATGSVTHSETGKTYLSYNIIKYDHELAKPISCTIFAEETIGSGPSNVIMKVF